MLTLSSLTAHLNFTTQMELPYWMGSTFRGGFGTHLRKACCFDVSRDCYGCKQRDDCIFYYTHMKKESIFGHSAPPKPLVLVPPFYGKNISADEGGYLDLNILLFGKFSQYLPHTIFALKLLGQSGIGDRRHYDMNKFYPSKIECDFSGESVYSGQTVNVEGMKTVDIEDIEPIEPCSSLQVGFTTPFISKSKGFPPELGDLIWYIRQRIIYYVNEYGDKSKVPDFRASANIISEDKHFHNLNRKSKRGGPQKFYGHTGVVDYEVDEMDENARWILAVGNILGAGPKATFGCGHLNISSDYEQK